MPEPSERDYEMARGWLNCGTTGLNVPEDEDFDLHSLARAIASAREEGRCAGLEEAAAFVRAHDVGYVQVGFRGGRFEAMPVSDITPQRMTLAAAISVLGGDK